jgi:hypothetical protein
MANSRAGGKLWQFTTGDTVRCTQCHGNYRLVGDPPTSGSPGPADRLSPHTSRYRGLLIANYRDRDLKPQNEPYTSGDFSLCYLCHKEAPFTDVSGDSRNDTNFRFHGVHLGDIEDEGSGGLDIDTLGAGQGNSICSECHFQTHSTKLAPWSANQDYQRGVNFAPNVRPGMGQSEPLWSLGNKSCALTCHGKTHKNKSY